MQRLEASGLVSDGSVSDVATAADGLCSFAHALRTHGTEHVCHTIESLVRKKLPHGKTWHVRAMNVGRFLSGRYYVDRLSTTCVSHQGAARMFIQVARLQLHSIQAKVWRCL